MEGQINGMYPSNCSGYNRFENQRQQAFEKDGQFFDYNTQSSSGMDLYCDQPIARPIPPCPRPQYTQPSGFGALTDRSRAYSSNSVQSLLDVVSNREYNVKRIIGSAGLARNNYNYPPAYNANPSAYNTPARNNYVPANNALGQLLQAYKEGKITKEEFIEKGNQVKKEAQLAVSLRILEQKLFNGEITPEEYIKRKEDIQNAAECSQEVTSGNAQQAPTEKSQGTPKPEVSQADKFRQEVLQKVNSGKISPEKADEQINKNKKDQEDAKLIAVEEEKASKGEITMTEYEKRKKEILEKGTTPEIDTNPEYQFFYGP